MVRGWSESLVVSVD